MTEAPNRKGAALIIDMGDTWILQRRDNKDGIKSPGKVGLWGGKIEPEDQSSYLDNAKRELFEETGLTEEDVEFETIGTLNGESFDIEGVQYQTEWKLFVARVTKPVAIHVYEGENTYELPKNFEMSDLDQGMFGGRTTEALAILKEYQKYHA